MKNIFYKASHPNVNLEIVIDANINESIKVSRSEFANRICNVKEIRTKDIEFSFYLDDIKKLRQIENLHNIINTGNFAGQTFEVDHLFAIGFPRKLFSWLKNISSSTLYKQLLHWHAAYYAFSFQEFDDKEFDPLVHSEVIQILNEYYPENYKAKFHNNKIENEFEYETKINEALEHYFSVSEKYTGSLPPEFLKNPYLEPSSNIDDYNWGLFPDYEFSILISYFNDREWIEIVERNSDKLKEFIIKSTGKQITIKEIDEMISKAEKDTLQRAESNSEMWQKWKHTFENFESRKTFTYSLIPNEKVVNGFIYLFQTESKDATKIGWTTKPSEFRKSGLQTGNHEHLIERGHFAASEKKTEDILHKMFKHTQIRQNGEWFHLTENEIQNILNKEWRMKNNIF